MGGAIVCYAPPYPQSTRPMAPGNLGPVGVERKLGTEVSEGNEGSKRIVRPGVYAWA